MYTYMAGSLGCNSRNWHNIVKQLYLNRIKGKMTDFLLELMQVRRYWKYIFKVLKGKTVKQHKSY